MLALTAVDVGYNVYQTNQSTKMSDSYNKYLGDFYGGKIAENDAYFDRYIKAHHINPNNVRFPFRAGMIFDESKLYSSDMALYNNQLARTGSYVHGATSLGRSAGYGYYASQRKPAFIQPRNPNHIQLYR